MWRADNLASMAGNKAKRKHSNGEAPATEEIGKKGYVKELRRLQVELLQLEDWVRHKGLRVVVVFEGRDTAGKGGVIKRITALLNPRNVRVVALPAPTERERTQWYFQRYVAHLPSAGEMVLFDRSWYNRAGVEKVMGFCTDGEYEAFLAAAPAFEKLLVDDGLLLFKYWLSVDQAEQEERFRERLEDPLKRWKLSPIDLKAREKYAEYGAAREAMFRATHRRHAPWHVVDFNDQKAGRLNLIRHLLDHLPDHHVPAPTLELPPLKGRPGKERFTGPVKPIRGRY